MQRTLLVLGPLVLVAMLVHPITVVSAQFISARVDRLQAEPREILNLPLRIHTLERRRQQSPQQLKDLASAKEELTTAQHTAMAISENNLHVLADSNRMAATNMFNRLGSSGTTFSFDQWTSHSNDAINALQELVTRGRAGSWHRLLVVRATFLDQYLEILVHMHAYDYDVTAYIQGAVNRAQALLDMDTREWRSHWGQVLQLIGTLRAARRDGQFVQQVDQVVGLIRRPGALDDRIESDPPTA
jgi:cell division protein FtsL